MANYAVNIVDNGDGTFSLSALFRSPAAYASGGTNLLTVTASTGFLQAATNTGDGLGHQMRSPSEVASRAMTILLADRSMNG